MKLSKSAFSKQQGFSLIEVLVGLFIFVIIFLGSSAAIKNMLGNQKQLNVHLIITNTMQARLQEALTFTGAGGICSAIDTSNIELAGVTYYSACTVEKITVAGTEIDWPVLVVSSSQTDATECATGTIKDSCYLVGK